MILTASIAVLKIFKDIMWIVFSVDYVGAMIMAAVYSMFVNHEALKIKQIWFQRGFKGICIASFVTLGLFAYIPHLSALYGEKPVYNCEKNLYPYVFPLLMCFNVFVGVLNLVTYKNFSK